jgi:hypothetical protein
MADISLQAVNAYGSNLGKNPASQVALTRGSLSKVINETQKPQTAREMAKEALPNMDKLTAALKSDTEGYGIKEYLKNATEKMKSGVASLSNPKDLGLSSLKEAMKEFTDGYNKVLEASQKSGEKGAVEAGLEMVSRTDTYEDSLKEVGIDVDTDNKVSFSDLNEQRLQEARDAFKALFSGEYSYGAKTQQNALRIVDSINNGSFYDRQGKQFDPMNVAGVM